MNKLLVAVTVVAVTGFFVMAYVLGDTVIKARTETDELGGSQ